MTGLLDRLEVLRAIKDKLQWQEYYWFEKSKDGRHNGPCGRLVDEYLYINEDWALAYRVYFIVLKE